MECGCNKNPNCKTCGGEGTVPDWLADPNVNSAADTWK